MAIRSTKILPGENGFEQVQELNNDGSTTAYSRRVAPNDPTPFSMNAAGDSFWDPMMSMYRKAGDGEGGWGDGSFLQQSYANKMAGYSGDMNPVTKEWEGGVAPIPDWNNTKVDYYGGKYGEPVLSNLSAPSGRWAGSVLPNRNVMPQQGVTAGRGLLGASGAWGGQPSAPPTQNRDYRMEGNGMPSSIVGLSGVTRKIDYAGRVLGDDGKPMSDANGLLSYGKMGLYSGDKLAYGIQDGRVVPLPQQGGGYGDVSAQVITTGPDGRQYTDASMRTPVPQQGQPSAIPSSQGMAPSAQRQMPYQWNTPQTTKQAAFNPMMNNFFSRYWGK